MYGNVMCGVALYVEYPGVCGSLVSRVVLYMECPGMYSILVCSREVIVGIPLNPR